jgi:hypothetical protein
MPALVQDVATRRPVIRRTVGRPITRLASPRDLGEPLKPFVFVDLIDAGIRISGP